jgi:Zn-dependent M28 family amino/carboxypeptidase
VDAKSIVADLNEDMFLPIYPLTRITIYGLDESTLGDMARAAAQAENLTVQPDPEPLRNAFVRSDQYSFIRHGIPALAMDFGYEAGSPEQKTHKDWLTHRYHAPSDDLNQPVDIPAAGKFEGIYRSLVISVANDSSRPQWKPNSFFQRFANGAGL